MGRGMLWYGEAIRLTDEGRVVGQIGVLNWFALLWEIEDYWGYITNCGTEGNLHGILVGRENLPDGVLYASKETHYSVFKAARMYRMDAVQVCSLCNCCAHEGSCKMTGCRGAGQTLTREGEWVLSECIEGKGMCWGIW